MPLYEFQCRSCHEVFEELLRSSPGAGEAVRCPACGAAEVTRLLSAPAALNGEPAASGARPGGCAPRGGFS